MVLDAVVARGRGGGLSTRVLEVQFGITTEWASGQRWLLFILIATDSTIAPPKKNSDVL